MHEGPNVNESKDTSPDNTSGLGRSEMTRREFLKKLGLLGSGAVTAGIAGRALQNEDVKAIASMLSTQQGREGLARYANERFHERRNKNEIEEQITLLVKEFQERYYIRISFEHNPHLSQETSTGTALLSERLRGMQVLQSEFSTYPDWFIHKLHIPSISLRQNIRTVDEGRESRPAGIRMGTHNALVLDPRTFDITNSLTITQEQLNQELGLTINHELMHAIDPLLRAEPLDGHSTKEEMERAWLDINQSNDGGIDYDPEVASILQEQNIRPKGFVRGYGLTDIYEDRATVFEMLVGHIYVKQAEEDTVLQEKKQMLARTLFLESKGLFVSEYFDERVREQQLSNTEHRDKHFRVFFESIRNRMIDQPRDELAEIYPEFDSIDDATYKAWREFHQNIQYLTETQDNAKREDGK